MELIRTQHGYLISGTVELSDLTTLQLPSNTLLDMTHVTTIDDQSIIFLRSQDWKILPPRIKQWFDINIRLNKKFDRPLPRSESYKFPLFSFIYGLWKALHPPTPLAMENTWIQLRKIGWNTSPTLLIIGAAFGVVTALQLLSNARVFGLESIVPRMLAIIIIDHLGPIISAQLLAAQCASAITADIATSRLNEEWDALISMNHDPYHALCWPRLLACVITSVLLVFLTTMTTIISSAIFTSTHMLYGSVQNTAQIIRLTIGANIGFSMLLVRSFAFGWIIGSIALYKGATADLSKGIGTCLNSAVFWINTSIIVTHILIQAGSALIGY